MHSNVFGEISIIISLGAVIALAMRLLRQPLIIGHIITGVIAGPSFLKIIHADTAFNGLSSMGVALLLFIIGLDLNIRVFSKLGKTVFFTTLSQITIISAVGFFVSQLFHFDRLESAVLGLALAMSSTIIIVKLFNDKKETTRLYAQIAIGVLLLQDLVATVAKIALAAKSTSGSVVTVELLAIRGSCLMLILFLAGKYIVPSLTKILEGNKELLLIFALAWGLGFATLFEISGFSIETGALFAGVSLASLPYSGEMASRLKPLRDFFIVIFFITLGQAMTPGKLPSVFGIAVAFSLVVLILKPLVVLVSMGVMGYTKRASFKSAISMSQISEFSLVFIAAALSIGVVSERASSAITLTALITFALSTYLIKYDNAIYSRIEERLRLFERKVTKLEQHDARAHYPVVLFGYQKGGHEFVRTFKNMGRRFIVVDYNPEAIETLERQHVNYLYGDATDPELIEELNLDKAHMVISTMSDFETNKFIAHWLSNKNPKAVFICSADSAEHASELYAEDASYVMLPHFIGSEKISAFIKRKGIGKTEFKKFREKHLLYLQSHYEHDEAEEA